MGPNFENQPLATVWSRLGLSDGLACELVKRDDLKSPTVRDVVDAASETDV